jgi:hypothetical protein
VKRDLGLTRKKFNIVIGSLKIHITLQQSEFLNVTIMFCEGAKPTHESLKSNLKHGIQSRSSNHNHEALNIFQGKSLPFFPNGMQNHIRCNLLKKIKIVIFLNEMGA